MKQSTQFIYSLKTGTYISALAIIFIVILRETLEHGIYQYPIVGAIYEMTWLPMLLLLFLLFIVYIVFLIKKTITIKQVIIPILITLFTFAFVFLQ